MGSKEITNSLKAIAESLIVLAEYIEKIGKVVDTEREIRKVDIVTPTIHSFDSYEDCVRNVIVTAGGAAFQSDIVKCVGMSKSQVSIILNKMHKEGEIIKIRKGKENVIRLKGKV